MIPGTSQYNKSDSYSNRNSASDTSRKMVNVSKGIGTKFDSFLNNTSNTKTNIALLSQESNLIQKQHARKQALEKRGFDAFRRNMANKVYDDMFSRGELFAKKYLEFKKNNPKASALSYLDKISSQYLTNI